MLEILLKEDPACSEACLFFSDDLFGVWLQSVQYDLQHDFAWVIDEADRSVVLTPVSYTHLTLPTRIRV